MKGINSTNILLIKTRLERKVYEDDKLGSLVKTHHANGIHEDDSSFSDSYSTNLIEVL